MGGPFNQTVCSSSSPSLSLVRSSGTTWKTRHQWRSSSSFLCCTPLNRGYPWPAFSSTLLNTSSKLQKSLQIVACVTPSQPEKTTTAFTNSTKLYVSGLSFRTSEENLRNAFQSFGQLIDVYLVMDKIANRSRGFAFLRYATKEESEKAIQGMHGKFLDGRVIFVEYAKTKSQLHQGVKQDSNTY